MSRPDSGRQSSRPTTGHLSQQELDSSAHRLSQVPQKFAARAVKAEPAESYAVTFYRDNPDVQVDKRSPTEKLEEIDSQLRNRELADNERFNFLIQKKSLCFLAFGENSAESLEALQSLGAFYNEQHRPESALRHLTKAQQIIKTVELSEADGLALAVEVADAHLASKATSRQDISRQLGAAETALAQFTDTKSDNHLVSYKRDLLLARIRARRNKYDEAMPLFERAIRSLDEANSGEKTQTTAALYGEIGEWAEAAKDTETAGKMYSQAYQIFLALDMPESAALIRGKLPGDFRSDSESKRSSSSARGNHHTNTTDE
jgi:tetratricopeptide (TPR) repeat protein